MEKTSMSTRKGASTVLHTAAVLYKQETKESCAVYVSSMAFDDLSLSLLFCASSFSWFVFMLVCTAAVHPLPCQKKWENRIVHFHVIHRRTMLQSRQEPKAYKSLSFSRFTLFDALIFAAAARVTPCQIFLVEMIYCKHLGITDRRQGYVVV
jgi:hypothetical protein